MVNGEWEISFKFTMAFEEKSFLMLDKLAANRNFSELVENKDSYSNP